MSRNAENWKLPPKKTYKINYHASFWRKFNTDTRTSFRNPVGVNYCSEKIWLFIYAMFTHSEDGQLLEKQQFLVQSANQYALNVCCNSLLSFFFDIMQWYEMFMNYKKLVVIVPYIWEYFYSSSLSSHQEWDHKKKTVFNAVISSKMHIQTNKINLLSHDSE